MPLFRYRAIAASGDILTGTLEAADRAAAAARLQSSGHYPISADEVLPGSLRSWLARDLFGNRLRAADLRLATRQLATLLHAALPLERSIEILADIAENAAARQLLLDLLEEIRGGAAFADAIARRPDVFPPVYVGMARAGEAGGALDAVLARLADFLERAHEVRETVKSALIYPVLLLVLAVLSIVILFAVVLPQFKPLFESAGKTLPLSTRIVLAVGDGIVAYWWLGLGAFLAVALMAWSQLRRPAVRRRWHGILLKLPFLGDLVVKTELARFTRTLGTLLGNGVVLVTALAISGKAIGNLAMAAAVERAAVDLREGKGIAEPLARTDVFPRLAVHLIRVGEESDQLKDMLLKIADIYEQEVKRAVDRLVALLVPALTVIIGGIVAAVITSILSAILSVYDLAL